MRQVKENLECLMFKCWHTILINFLPDKQIMSHLSLSSIDYKKRVEINIMPFSSEYSLRG